MKNKFLLLGGIAAIAVISAANYAQADPITENFDVKIKLINKDAGLEKVQDLDFGSILNGSYVDDRSLVLAPDGTVSGGIQEYGKQKPAILNADPVEYADASSWDIQISGAEELKAPSESQGVDYYTCGYVSNWDSEKFSYSDPVSGVNGVLGFKIGATFTLPEVPEYLSIDTDCSATATATLIYTGGANSGN